MTTTFTFTFRSFRERCATSLPKTAFLPVSTATATRTICCRGIASDRIPARKFEDFKKQKLECAGVIGLGLAVKDSPDYSSSSRGPGTCSAFKKTP